MEISNGLSTGIVLRVPKQRSQKFFSPVFNVQVETVPVGTVSPRTVPSGTPEQFIQTQSVHRPLKREAARDYSE